LIHPRIPRFVESFSHDGLNYLVQEFIEGYPLSYYIVSGKRFTEEEAKCILFQLIEILDYLHRQEGTRHPVIHRDLRLSNLIWCSNTVYLLDFGLARYCKEDSEQTLDKQENIIYSGICDRRPGTRTYAMLRSQVSPSSDLFGAGVVGLDLFTNWIEDEALFQKPWQEILPASDRFKSIIDRLITPERQFASARSASLYI
jgi:serine/threonine protein kinase